MTLKESMNQLNNLLAGLTRDLGKVHRGNKTAAQRVRVGTIKLEKIAKVFRKDSVAAEKSGRFKSHKLRARARKIGSNTKYQK
ncbi:MAG: hypothetical protein HY861_01075 [Chlamydiia bacterium]|nr:hypothetical protein [Chlamydiia bacterium]